MSTTTVIVWILTALAAVVVVATRLRLGGEGAAGRFALGRGLLNAHTTSGTLALLLWVAHLLAPDDSMVGGAGFGIFAIGAWWATAACGLVILTRWLPSRGRHADHTERDSWGGAGLSILAHVGMVVGVIVFTFAYLTTA